MLLPTLMLVLPTSQPLLQVENGGERVILDEPLKLRLPHGYPYCPKCWRYEHHYPHFTVCQAGKYDDHLCGTPLVIALDITWRDFLAKTAHAGSGPGSTFHEMLRREFCVRTHQDPDSGNYRVWDKTINDDQWPDDLKAEAKEARRICHGT